MPALREGKGELHLSSLFGRGARWRHVALALASAAALSAAPASAFAAQSYTIDVTASSGQLTGATAIADSGATVAGSVYGTGYRIVETSPGPFTIIGSGKVNDTTSASVYFGATVSSSTYTENLNLALPQVMPTAVVAPAAIYMTSGQTQTVALSVYSPRGMVSDGAPVTLTPSGGLSLKADSGQAQVGSTVYASTMNGSVTATLQASVPGTYDLQVDSPPGSALSGGTIPVYVGAPGLVPSTSSLPPPNTGNLGSPLAVNGVTGTIVMDASFSATAAENLLSSDGALTLGIPAGAIASSGDVLLRVVEFNASETAQLLQSSKLASYESPLGLSFAFLATVGGVAVNQLAAPLTATFNLSALQGGQSTGSGTSTTHAFNAATVDLMEIGTNGALTFAGGKSTATGVQSSVDALAPFTLLEVQPTFPDIQGYWAQADIQLMASKFVVNGFPNGDFQPQGQVTRAQFTTMLLRMLNIPIDPNAKVTFQDVSPSAWYYGAIATAVEKGIVQGESSTTFAPNASITREELVTMLVRAMEMEGWASSSQASSGLAALTATFHDASTIDSWAQSDMAVAMANGLVNGVTPTQLDPLGVTTRAQATVWLARVFRKFV